MDPDFWRGRWRKGEIGFHQAAATPALVRRFDRLELARGARVLVPLSGKSLDLLWLADHGVQVRAAELVDDAVQAFYADNGLKPTVAEDGAHVRYEAGGITTWSGDFFAIRPRQIGELDAAFDRAAMIALPLQMRPRYVAQLRALLPAGARILLITMEHDPLQKSGPPFPITAQEVRALYAGATIELLEERDILEESPKFRAAGVDRLTESAWLVTL